MLVLDVLVNGEQEHVGEEESSATQDVPDVVSAKRENVYPWQMSLYHQCVQHTRI